MKQKKSDLEGYYIPISIWNLNELFTNESISPFSFYFNRNYGNPVSRDGEALENENSLILFQSITPCDIVLYIKTVAIDKNFLFPMEFSKKKKNANNIVYGYSKTIYLNKDNFILYFSSEEVLKRYRISAFMLLEVKTLSKYDDLTSSNMKVRPDNYDLSKSKVPEVQFANIYQETYQIYFDRAFNQIKGLLYGYIVSSIGLLNQEEQSFLTNLIQLKNSIGGLNTDLALSKSYSNDWVKNINVEIDKCKISYEKLFPNLESVYFDNLRIRLKEVDMLFGKKCEEIEKQNSQAYLNAFNSCNW